VPTFTSPGSLEQRWAVVLHADLVDYSRHLADHPETTIETVEEYRELVAARVSAGGGSLIDFVGDNFLGVFDDAKAAMSAAIGICTTIKNRPPESRLLFRMGLDAGPVRVTADGRIFGDPVTVATRIQSITDTGGINVSGAVYRALDEPAFRFAPLGLRSLKNVPEAVHVYRLVGLDSGQPAVEERAERSVAVLPILDPTADAPDSPAAALRMELLTSLVKLPGLEVIDVDDRGPATDVHGHSARYVLECGVQRSHDRLRVWALLIDTPTVNQIWGDRWDGTADDVFDLTERVAQDIVRALEVELVIGEPARLYRSLVDPASVERIYRGWHQLAKGTASGLLNAIELFETVTATVPDTATGPALTAFACWYGAMSGLSDDPEAHLARAWKDANTGLALGDDTGLSHMVKAALMLSDGDDLDEALEEARTAQVKRPTCDVTFGIEASIERYRGNWQAAVEAARRAMSMSPTFSHWYETTLVGAYHMAGHYQQAADIAEGIVARTPNAVEALLLLAACQEALGLHRRAAGTITTFMTRCPDITRADVRRMHHFRDPAVLDRWMAQLEAAGLP
jgi:adenylate cyclase